MVGAGSFQLCRAVIEASCDPGHEVVVPVPAFSAYDLAATVASARIVRIPLSRDHLDLPAMARAVTEQTRAIIVCSPHNPTSTAVGRDEFEEFLGGVPSDRLVVLDEAYTEFVTDPGALRGDLIMADHPNLVVLRTFSKAYGLAGLRVGYALAGASLAGALRKVISPFSISRVSEAAAIASLQPEARRELCRRVTVTTRERDRVAAELERRGFDVAPSQANFLWLPSASAQEWAARLEERGVITRPVGQKGLRLTIGTPDENAAALEAFSHLVPASID